MKYDLRYKHVNLENTSSLISSSIRFKGIGYVRRPTQILMKILSEQRPLD